MESYGSTAKEGTAFELIASSDDDFGAGYKNCTKCSILKPLDVFWVEPKGVMGRKSWCKACSGERTIKRPAKRGEIPLKTIRNAVSKVTNDRIQQAFEAAAYRYLKEIM